MGVFIPKKRKKACFFVVNALTKGKFGVNYNIIVQANFLSHSAVKERKMTKRDLVVKIAKDTGFIQNDVAVVVQKTLDYIAEDLIDGNTIELRNFGVFEIKVRKSRKGRNPNQPKNEVVIPERTVVKFRAGKELKEAVEKLNPSRFK
ncbi:MAG: HU family DNA-binding protein [Victivallaceae bacterium]